MPLLKRMFQPFSGASGKVDFVINRKILFHVSVGVSVGVGFLVNKPSVGMLCIELKIKCTLWTLN